MPRRSLKTLSSTKRNSLSFTWLIEVFPLVCSCQSRALKGDFLSPNHEVPCWFWNISSWNQQATAKSYRAVHEASWTYFDFFINVTKNWPMTSLPRFLTTGVTESKFCQMEMRWAIEADKNVILVAETAAHFLIFITPFCSWCNVFYTVLNLQNPSKSWFCDGVLSLAGHTRESGQKLMWKILTESQQPNVVFFSGNLENSSPGCDKVILRERWIIVNEYWIRDWTRCNPWPCRAYFSSFRLKVHDVVEFSSLAK